jgi:hypothetical protein
MIRPFLVIAVVLTLAGFGSQETQATPVPISGLLNISGSGPGPGGASVSPDFFDVQVDAGSNGSFTGMANKAVAIASPSIFLGLSSTGTSLWSVGGFTLELTLEEVISDPDQITMSGPAIIFAPGTNPTFGAQWTYTSHIGGAFDFVLKNGLGDSGTTIILLGVGLLAIAGCRARFAKS